MERSATPRSTSYMRPGDGPAPHVDAMCSLTTPCDRLHLHRDRWQLQHLMRVVRPRQDKCRVATWTSLGAQLLNRRGREKRLAMAQMPRFPARFARCGSDGAQARLLVW